VSNVVLQLVDSGAAAFKLGISLTLLAITTLSRSFLVFSTFTLSLYNVVVSLSAVDFAEETDSLVGSSSCQLFN